MRWPRFIRRKTMLPPRRPIPISMVIPSGAWLLDRRSDRRRQRLPSGRRLFPKRHPQNREPARREGLQVAQRLRLLEDREAKRLAWDGHVFGVVLDDLQEKADLGAAFVQLSGRVEEARPVAGGGGVTGRIAHRSSDRGDGGLRG